MVGDHAQPLRLVFCCREQEMITRRLEITPAHSRKTSGVQALFRSGGAIFPQM
jgi:hypothetical protein